MAVKKFSSAYYVVSNMDAAITFYRDFLGLNIKFRDGDRWTQFDVNGVALALADPSEGAVPPGGGATVVLEVDNLQEMRDKLMQRGVPVNNIVDMGGHGKYFTAKDPAGNVVQIFARSS
jgi:predicted enzyme related to lactoylglutathione lyase